MASQTNRRKTGCGSNSDGSSNASSPSVSASLNNSTGTPYYPHLTSNAPKNGVVIPNRVFVGGIASSTTESELTAFFSKYGQVKDVKIIVDRGGVSKGYGFVTFDSEEEANKLQQAADDVNFQGRRLNIAAAVKKQVCLLQPYNRSFDASSTSPPMPPNVYFHNGIPYTYHNGMAFFSSGNPPTNAIAPIQAHPESVNIYQGTFGPPHGSAATPTFGPTMMYHPCPNPPPPVYLPAQQYAYQPLPFDSYYQVASQNSGLVYSAGAGPTNISSPTPPPPNSSLVAVPDSGNATQAVQLIPAQLNPMYAPPHILHNVYYSAQTVYPVGVEGMTQYGEIQNVESPPSNVSAEGSSCSKPESESIAQSALPANSKQNEAHASTATPVVSWLHCSEKYECSKPVNGKRTDVNDNSQELTSPAPVYPVALYNPIFSRPPLPRHPHPSAMNGYHENQTRIRNYVPYMYNVETAARRPANVNVPKQPLCGNNNYVVSNSHISGVASEFAHQTRNMPRLPRHQKGRPIPMPSYNPNRFPHPVAPYFPRFNVYPNSQHPQILPFPPSPFTASRRFPSPINRRHHSNIPASFHVSSSSSNYNNSNNNSNNNNNNNNSSSSNNSEGINKSSTSNTVDNCANNNNNNNFSSKNNNNIGGNGAVAIKIVKPVTKAVSAVAAAKVESETGALSGAGDAPPIITHHSSVSHSPGTVSGPTPVELSHQMQKLST